MAVAALLREKPKPSDADFNRGLHVITMRCGKVYSLDVFEDSQEVARGLAIQAECGLTEATAEQIVS